MTEKAKKGRKNGGLIDAIKVEYKKGNKDVASVTKKTGAKSSTVLTQFYKLGYKKPEVKK